MKRIDVIKKRLCELIDSCPIDEFKKLLFELQEVSEFNRMPIIVFNQFEKKYQDKNDEEMSEIIKGGEYSIEFIKWLSEEV